jgi:hypothetical protein
MMNFSMDRIITMPNEAVLRNRFNRNEVSRLFAERTRIVQRLANKEVVPTGVCTEVQRALCDYGRDLRLRKMPEEMVVRTMQTICVMRSAWTEWLLEDYPDVIAQLRMLKIL